MENRKNKLEKEELNNLKENDSYFAKLIQDWSKDDFD